MSAPVVTLLTDFGVRDGYVGAVKGVLLTLCPGAQVVDVSHEIPPGDVDAGAYVLRQSARFFPPSAVHLAVVDPGVGSGRRALAVEADGVRFVAPDNGLLTFVLESAAAVSAHSIESPVLLRDDPSDVFHGRDLFAPVAAHLARGGDVRSVGPPLDPATLVRRPWPPVSIEGSARTGAVVYVDRFGNLITNLSVRPGEARGEVELGDRRIPVRRIYADVPAGEAVALRGSSGLLEVACNGASARERLGVGVGAVITWRLRPGS